MPPFRLLEVEAKAGGNAADPVPHRPSRLADVGGDICASLADKADIAPIERTLAAFMSAI